MSLPRKHIAEGIAVAIMVGVGGEANARSLQQLAIRGGLATTPVPWIVNPRTYAQAQAEGCDMANFIQTKRIGDEEGV